jgi:WD40 repeat protein
MRSRRTAIFALLLLVCTAGAAVAIAAGIRESEPDTTAGAVDALTAAKETGTPTVVFRNLKEGRGHGQVAVAPLAQTVGTPTLQPLQCDRVYYGVKGGGICLARGKGFAAGYEARLFDADMKVRHEVPVEGIPSRARVSPDGRYGSVTLFVAGHSYADAGQFSTQTTLIDLKAGKKIADMEDFVTLRDGRRITAIDVNYWGVTFAKDSDRFYATLATGGKTYLIEGSVSKRQAHVIHENVECPSLSPDGTRIAYKRRTQSAGTPWRLTVLDLTTKRETTLAEPRSVDDQAEWLDDDTVVYGIGGSVWKVPADGSGSPSRLIPDADSPAVIHW